ncbi:unnamed protein product [Prunus armeniaca]|uniref:RNase H type-1 domain-containing protein n=1 Tax=Prunus armeniaca TaxID=36596 RepID=A0A6J5W3K9_PRUAR|nr:unnamed protein product [Prunus armeniaca]
MRQVHRRIFRISSLAHNTLCLLLLYGSYGMPEMQLCFGSSVLPPDQIVLSVKNYDAEYHKILLIHHRRSSLPIPDKKWQSIPLGHFKLNVDGALSLSSSLRGVGVAVRDSYGCLCGVVAMRAPSMLSVLATELYALKIGISFAVDASLTPLVIESNSSTTIYLIIQENPCYEAEGALIEDIRQFLASFSSYSVRFVPRTTNGVADRLARFNLVQKALDFWFFDPLLWL